jgi:hypothetical protein
VFDSVEKSHEYAAWNAVTTKKELHFNARKGRVHHSYERFHAMAGEKNEAIGKAG